MPKLLSEAEIAAYRRDGDVAPLRAVDAAQAGRWLRDIRRRCGATPTAPSPICCFPGPTP
jgi:hypothetical protein